MDKFNLPTECPKCGQRLPWGDPEHKVDPQTGKEWMQFQCHCSYTITRPCLDAKE